MCETLVDAGLAVEAVDRLELRKPGVAAEFERQILEPVVRRLAVELPLLGVEAERDQRQQVVAGVFVDLRPGEPAGGMSL